MTDHGKTAPPQPIWRRFTAFGKPLLLFFGLLFLLIFIIRHGEESAALLSQINVWWFSLSILIALGDNLIISVVFYWLTKKNNLETNYHAVGEMFFLGQIAKYIPGRFWGFLYQATYFRSPAALKKLFLINLELTSLVVWRSLCIGIVIVLATFSSLVSALSLLVGLIGFYFLVKKRWITGVFGWLPFLRDKNQASRNVTESAGAISSTFIVSSALYLLANLVLLVSAFNFSITDSVMFIAFFCFAWIAGVLAFILPAGIGVRELVFVLLAAQWETDYSIETLTTIAIIYRFWQMFHEIGAIGIGLYFRKLSK